MYLFRSCELSMIDFLSSFVVNGALLPLTLFCFFGACLSVIVLKRLENHHEVFHCYKTHLHSFLNQVHEEIHFG